MGGWVGVHGRPKFCAPPPPHAPHPTHPAPCSGGLLLVLSAALEPCEAPAPPQPAIHVLPLGAGGGGGGGGQARRGALAVEHRDALTCIVLVGRSELLASGEGGRKEGRERGCLGNRRGRLLGRHGGGREETIHGPQVPCLLTLHCFRNVEGREEEGASEPHGLPPPLPPALQATAARCCAFALTPSGALTHGGG